MNVRSGHTLAFAQNNGLLTTRLQNKRSKYYIADVE